MQDVVEDGTWEATSEESVVVAGSWEATREATREATTALESR